MLCLAISTGPTLVLLVLLLNAVPMATSAPILDNREDNINNNNDHNNNIIRSTQVGDEHGLDLGEIVFVQVRDTDPEDVEGYFEGDIELPNEDNMAKRDLSMSSKKWLDGVVYYRIHANYSSSFRRLIITAMREIEDDTKNGTTYCVRFVPKGPNTTNYVDIAPGRGCHSFIGQGHGRVPMSLGNGCQSKGVIMHEMLHVLGFVHEQNRIDRNLHVKIHLSNVAQTKMMNFRKSHSLEEMLPDSKYDHRSIMHYNPYAFARDRSWPTITPRGDYPRGVHIGQRRGLSEEDTGRVQRLYNCTVDTAHIKRPSARNLLGYCDFEDETCELIQELGETSPWKRHNGTTPSGTGPNGDFTNGAEHYLYVDGSRYHQDVARLKTHSIGTGHICVKLALYNYGPRAGTLHVFAEGPGGKLNTLLKASGSKTKTWRAAKLGYKVKSPIQIVLESRVVDAQPGPYHDVAIDDFQIYTGLC